MRAGFDRKAQKQTSVAHERELIAKIRKSSGVAETEADRADTRAALKSAENYEEAYFSARKECHWSDKPLDEMTERDWRIFKEDFNISYKVRVELVSRGAMCSAQVGFTELARSRFRLPWAMS